MDILELRKVNKRFGGVHAIKELDLTVTQGTVHGLIGPNGSGKTTTFNVISGVFPPTDGQIFFGGRDITGLPAYEIARLGISRTFQIPKVMGRMSVLDNVMCGYFAKTKTEAADTFLHAPFRASRQERAMRARAMEQLAFVADTRRVKQVAIVHDWENKWALEGSCGPRNCGLGYWKELACHYNALARRGITVDFVNQESDLTGYGLVIVPMQYLLRNKFAQALCDYTAQGGTVVVTYWTGVVDESDLCYLGDTPYGLTDLLGLRREEIDALYDGETCHCAATDDGAMEADGSILCEVAALNDTDPATPLMLYAEDYYAGCPAVAVHAFGKGQAYYLASRFNADFYNDFYAQVCEKAGLQPAWPEQLPAGVLATRRGDFVFMQNCNDHSVDIDGVELEKYSTRLVQLEPVDEDDES